MSKSAAANALLPLQARYKIRNGGFTFIADQKRSDELVNNIEGLDAYRGCTIFDLNPGIYITLP